MAPHGHTRLRTLIDIVRRPQIGLGMLAIILVFTGHFALFTYVRPFLETVAGVGVTGISAILLGFGLANFLGTLLGGVMLERSLRLTLIGHAAGDGRDRARACRLGKRAARGRNLDRALGPRLRRRAGRLVDLDHPRGSR